MSFLQLSNIYILLLCLSMLNIWTTLILIIPSNIKTKFFFLSGQTFLKFTKDIESNHRRLATWATFAIHDEPSLLSLSESNHRRLATRATLAIYDEPTLSLSLGNILSRTLSADENVEN
jgi:hypothetical protein